jgi:AcrR family transcriptional regulator
MRRHSAEERRALVIEAASQEFAARGLYGATGEGISYRAGISHPYLLRLFGSKKDLFREVIDRTFEDLHTGVTERVNGSGTGQAPEALESAIQGVLGPDERLLLLLQFLAACGDDDIRPLVRRRFAGLYQHLASLSDGDEDELREVFERVIFRSATAALRLLEIASKEQWARRLLASS